MPITPAIEAALRTGDRLGAARLARQEIERSPNDPDLLHLAAYHCMQTNASEDAFELLERARSFAPHDTGILNSLGNLYRRSGEVDKALELFREVCAREPANNGARFNLARLLEDVGESEAARAQYETIVMRAPKDMEAQFRLFYILAVAGNYDQALARARRVLSDEAVFGNLASIALQRADYAAARRFGEQAVESSPTPRAVMTLAQAEFRDGDPARARERVQRLLEGVLTPEDRAFAFSLLGDIEDKLDETASAFANYAKSKALLADVYAPQFARPGQRTGREFAEDLRTFFEKRQWRRSGGANQDAARPEGVRGHVFFLGFPRSGTTLLEQSLATHPGLHTLDETGPLVRSSTALWASPEALEAFVDADEEQLCQFRAAYWRLVSAESPNLDGKILIDKMPLDSLLMAHIERLFPEARIIFAVRDPRDVVFSCFRTRFLMTAFMYEFCTPQSAAKFYDAVMSVTEIYRRSLAIPVFETRYEELVADFPGVIKAVCEFVGVEPVADMLRPEKRAQSRIVATPSGAQIARGLYDGSQQWRRYSAQLDDVLPMLEPWVRRFGYAA